MHFNYPSRLNQALRISFCFTAIAIILIPPILALNFIQLYGVNTLIFDDFPFIEMFQKLQQGAISLNDLLPMYNGHSFFLGRLVMLATGAFTHWNAIAEMYISWTLLLLSEIVLFCLMKCCHKPFLQKLLFFLPVSFLIFSLRPYEVFLYGLVFTFAMAVLFFLLSVYLLDCTQRSKHQWEWFGCAMATALVATFSGQICGVLVWPIGLLQILLFQKDGDRQHQARQKAMTVLWLSMWSAIWFIYGWLIKRSEPILPLQDLSFNFKKIVEYMLALFGSPVTGVLPDAQIAGAVVLLIYGLVLIMMLGKIRKSGLSDDLRIALCLILFGLLTCALIVLGRVGSNEIIQATSPRYVLFSNISLIGLYIALSNSNYEWKKLRIALMLAVLGLIVLQQVYGYKNAGYTGEVLRDRHKKFAYFLKTYKLQTDEALRQIFPQIEITGIRHTAQMAEKNSLSIFADPLDSTAGLPVNHEPALYAVDMINNTINDRHQSTSKLTISPNTTNSISFSGWALDGRSLQEAHAVDLMVDDNREIPVCYGLYSPNVGKYFHSRNLIHCGLYASFATKLLTPGPHKLSLRIISRDGKSFTQTPVILIVDKGY